MGAGGGGRRGGVGGEGGGRGWNSLPVAKYPAMFCSVFYYYMYICIALNSRYNRSRPV